MSASAETFARTSRCISIAVLLASAPPLPAQDDPPVLYVASNAVHNGTGCGVIERPCRSISQAIANAEDGSLIEVGPGIYGDIDGDGDASGAGEEVVDANTALVTIDKPLTVYSVAGALQTVIRSPKGGQFIPSVKFVVEITADDVTFGRPNGGFTLIGDKSVPVAGTEGVNARAANVTIEGNVATDNSAGGFVVDVGGGDIDLLGNVATRNAAAGFAVAGASFVLGRARLERNIAADNEVGFFLLSTRPNVVMNNVATRNRTGFSLTGSSTGSSGATITGNVAVANAEFGIESRGLDLIGNAVIGNGIAGFRVLISATVQRNNIFGNGEAATGCGVILEEVPFVSPPVVDATNNYWGKPTGPGPNPGDRAYKDCVISGSVITSPFSPIPFPIEGPSGD